MKLDLESSKRLLCCGARLCFVVLALGCGETEASDDAGAADAVVCEGDHYAGDAATVAPLVDCTRVSGDLIFTGNELELVELSQLVRVDGNLTVWGNPNLTAVKLSRLVHIGGYLLIEANNTLTSVDVPVLVSVNERAIVHHADVSISGNPQLPTCQASAVRDQLHAHGFTGSVKITDNLGTCSE